MFAILYSPMKTIVAIFAHPDDESFGPGGTLALLSKENDVYAICVTNGDAGQKTEEITQELGIVRQKELLRASKILGVKEVFFLGYKDGTLSNIVYHEIAEKIQKKLEELRPSQLITFEPHGVSGHLDHIAVSMITTYVFQKLSFVHELWYYCVLKNWQEMRERYFIYLPPGYEAEEVDKVIDISSVVDTKIAAMHEHKSQKEDMKGVLKRLLALPKNEYFLIIKK